MVYDLKKLKEILQREIVDPFDHRFLNFETPPFDRVIPTPENLAIEIWRRVAPSFAGMPGPAARGSRVRDRGPVRGLLRGRRMIRLTRRYRFSASHRLHSPGALGGGERRSLREVQQPARARARLCAGGEREGSPSIRAPARVVDVPALDRLVEAEVLSRLRHRDLNTEARELAGAVADHREPGDRDPRECWRDTGSRSFPAIPPVLERIRIYETRRNVFETSR